MISLSQRVKGAVLTAPYLLKNIQNIQGYNPVIFNSIIHRLLPFRSSVEIEHAPIKYSLFINSLIKNKHFPTRNGIKLLDYDESWGVMPETKISITANSTDLKCMYNILQTLKEIAEEDENGSIHIHIDISKWWSDAIKNNYYKSVGLFALGNSSKQEILDFINSFLNDVAKVFNYPINIETFNFKKGVPQNREHMDTGFNQGNIRTIAFDYPNNIMRSNEYDRWIQFQCSNRPSYRKIQNKRKNSGIPNDNGKFNWVNIRQLSGNSHTMEYRVGDCSFDYHTIMKYFVECNRLTKRFLAFVDYIGKRAIGDGFEEFFINQ